MKASLVTATKAPPYLRAGNHNEFTLALVTSGSRRQLIRASFGVASAGLLALAIVPQARARKSGAETSGVGKYGPMEYVRSADGTRIAYLRAGEGPPLVLVHGIADDHSHWSQLMPAFAEHFTVYAVDRRGRGQSGKTNNATYSIEREFEDLSVLIDAIEEPVNLLGHSYGALCSLEASLRTDNLDKLVLYEPPIPIPPGSPGAPPGKIEKIETLRATGDREGVALSFFHEIVGLPEEEIAAVRSSPAWQVVIAAAPTIVDEVRAVDEYFFHPERFRDLETPTLLLMGSESPPFLQAATEAVADTLPNCQLVTFKGHGHIAMDTAPELFLDQVMAFLGDEPQRTDCGSIDEC